MNFKKISLICLTVCFCMSSFLFCGCSFSKKEKAKTDIKQSTNISAPSKDVWCITFQLVWNDFMDKFANGNPVQFENGNPEVADELNKKLYTSDLLAEDSYYKTQGKISSKLKKQIEKEIWKKFKEKSDIISLINWNAKDSYLFYAMLKKNFTFQNPFDELNCDKFGKGNSLIKYFGITARTSNKVRDNVVVLFWENEEEFAVKLYTKENEDVILYRTNSQGSLEELYARLVINAKYDNFTKKDVLKVPFIDVDKTISYDELCGKKIKGSDFVISQALQTIKFKMDNKGGTLKSEAALGVMKTAFNPDEPLPRYFVFDKRFVLFLKEADKDKPYYAMIIDNDEYLVRK